MFSTRAASSLKTNHYSPQPPASVNNVIYSVTGLKHKIKFHEFFVFVIFSLSPLYLSLSLSPVPVSLSIFLSPIPVSLSFSHSCLSFHLFSLQSLSSSSLSLTPVSLSISVSPCLSSYLSLSPTPSHFFISFPLSLPRKKEDIKLYFNIEKENL